MSIDASVMNAEQIRDYARTVGMTGDQLPADVRNVVTVTRGRMKDDPGTQAVS